MANRKDVTVVIRSAGERTVPALWSLLKQQVPEEQIFEVNEAPLSKALKKSYQIGINDNRRWILIIDGDVLPFRNMLDRLVTIFAGLDDRIFTLQCNIVDKMTQSYRRAGVHMHRTSLLKQAINQIPDENTTTRPETETISNMEGNGYLKLFIDEVLALHDYKQFYRDLFRKAYFTAHKHANKISYFKKIWNKYENDDYSALLAGLKKGELYNGYVTANTTYFRGFDIDNILSGLGLVEKEAIDLTCLDFGQIERVYNEFSVPPEYWNFKVFFADKTYQISAKHGYKRRFFELKTKLGLLSLGCWVIGRSFEKVGSFIKQKAEN